MGSSALRAAPAAEGADAVGSSTTAGFKLRGCKHGGDGRWLDQEISANLNCATLSRFIACVMGNSLPSSQGSGPKAVSEASPMYWGCGNIQRQFGLQCDPYKEPKDLKSLAGLEKQQQAPTLAPNGSLTLPVSEAHAPVAPINSSAPSRRSY